jgi:hypothetical protein
VRANLFRLVTTQSQWFCRISTSGSGLALAVVLATLDPQNRNTGRGPMPRRR